MIIEGLADPMIEQFQNPDTFDNVFEEMGDDMEESFADATRANPMKSPADDYDIPEEEEDITEEEEHDNNPDMDVDMDDMYNMDNINNTDNKDDDDDDDVETEDMMEGFRGSQMQMRASQTLLLKCVLFGLLFYILGSPKTYSYTNKLIPSCLKVDRTIIHSIIFTVSVFLVYQFI